MASQFAVVAPPVRQALRGAAKPMAAVILAHRD